MSTQLIDTPKLDEKLSLYPLNINQLSQIELSQLVSEVLVDYANLSITIENDNQPAELIEVLKKHQSAYIKGLNHVSATIDKQVLSEVIQNRHQDFQALYHIFKSKKYLRQHTEVKAYHQLLPTMMIYTDFYKSNEDLKTAHVTKLLEQLKDDKYSDSLSTLNLSSFVEKLKESQSAYEKAISGLSLMKMKEVTYDVARLRKEVSLAYRNLVDYCKLMGRIKTDKGYQDLLVILNHSRKHYATMLNRRNGSKKKLENKGR